MYDIEVTGYNNKTNKLHLFDIDSVDESIVEDGIDFDKNDIEKNLTLFLYPDDSDEQGRLLRIYQQYLMVSAGAQLILDECTAKGSNLYDLPDYAVIQINDTHPTMVIPELIVCSWREVWIWTTLLTLYPEHAHIRTILSLPRRLRNGRYIT